ncbi:hypothetical protein SPBR_07872 [Sporothrix brasiliensis 5110]|uniref:Uncharacterized protein n=1 Tax=Sporothrix brasiliensis 5110 TaxID=1398154 RepID=A0A0C2IIH3_9PEZI|nr:uncharacterized protein SPBR_07872 [Sporothrix brasiliensis 5110]KIH88991.1 hypothetical protein SPBR_07872 [Sporothrix brasiliensis 5110]
MAGQVSSAADVQSQEPKAEQDQGKPVGPPYRHDDEDLANPIITNDFNSAGDIDWYGTAYMLANCTLQLISGKLCGFGIDSWAQAPNTTMAVAVGASLMFFGQQLLGTIFTSIGQNEARQPADASPRRHFRPVVDAAAEPNTGATEACKLVPAANRPAALAAYNDSLCVVFRVGLILASISILGARAMAW